MTGKLTGARIASFRRKLLAWYRDAKRDLPWRSTRDPYRIWLAEIMLQQTRVAAVVPHYGRFLDRFPTVEALAQSPVEDVLRLWSGLGYYTRARNLHRAAREIVARHAGQFPSDPSAARALPGIGRYTAAAILSIAYGEPHAVLDGNVARVLARLDAIRGDLRAPGRWRGLEARAQEILAQSAPGDWNQAMMELGAVVCLLKAPRCDACPVRNWCGAAALGIAGELPAARAKPKPVRVTLAAAVFVDPRRRTLLLQSNAREAALFSRLWQFPAVEADGDPRAALASHLQSKFGLRAADCVPAGDSRHSVTFRQIRLAAFVVRVKRLPRVAGARTPKLAELHRLPISNATRKIAEHALRMLSQRPHSHRP
ncbi:MAG TPA: A/G-specific adenine glycosylase [Methylomirabilota bacterium]|nr:A/G-specific adenine glycosylase [Methylomirabilota bacterium]